MRTLGIDLASQDKRTAACEVEWSVGGARVELPRLGVSDDVLIELIGRADRVAIDAPFGWPEEFIEAVYGYARDGLFPTTLRKRLRYRETDRFVEERARLPLSVSSDRIAVTAMRCASILTRLAEDGHPVDRTGAGKVLEVYPAAALAAWAIDPKGYKAGDHAKAARKRILNDRVSGAGDWLRLSDGVRAKCVVTMPSTHSCRR